MAATAVQYGFQQQFCDAIVNADANAKTQAYADIGTKVFNEFGTTAFEDSFQGAMTTDISAYQTVGYRGWMYQSCTEFGYYQIANPNAAESARSAQITLSYHDDACNRLFGITTPVNVAKTNARFFNHLADKSVTNIFFTNGSDDPWSTLSLNDTSPTASANPALKFFTITGAAHCDDLGERISEALTTARSEFETLASNWLSAE